LSVPQQERDILRHEKISIRCIDENGKNTTLKTSGFLAVACQHEIDHLNGILITDRYERQENLRKMFNIPQKIYEKNT
jgi:peptide deformylase